MYVGHDLVVGGSGMLATLCLRLAAEGRVVSVVGRSRERLGALALRATGGPGTVAGVAVDYRDRAAFRDALAGVAAAHGTPSRAVCWIHEEAAPDGPLDAADWVSGAFWHVMSSAADDPSRPSLLRDWRRRFAARHPGLFYRQVVLGFVVESGGRARWHTDEEISAGVGAAMRADAAAPTTVGTTRPWRLRP